MVQKINVCAIVVTYNRVNMLKSTIEHYLRSAVSKLVVVDNASTDGTAEYLELCKLTYLNRIDVIRLAENTGGAGGFYHGLKYARDRVHADWLVLSDDDSYPDKSAIDLFIGYATSLAYGSNIVAAAVRFPSGELCPMNRPLQRLSVRSYFSNIMRGEQWSAVSERIYSQSSIEKILASSFVGMFVPAECLRESGVLPRKDYFLYWDDISFCLDMRLYGCNSIFDPRLQFYHDCPRASGSIDGKRFYYLVRNGLRAFAKFPFPANYIARFYKVSLWFCDAIRNRCLSHFFKAIKDA